MIQKKKKENTHTEKTIEILSEKPYRKTNEIQKEKWIKYLMNNRIGKTVSKKKTVSEKQYRIFFFADQQLRRKN